MDKDSKEKTAFTTFAGLYQISAKLTENTIHYFQFHSITSFKKGTVCMRGVQCQNSTIMI